MYIFNNETLENFENNSDQFNEIEQLEKEFFKENKEATQKEKLRDLYNDLNTYKKTGELDIVEMLKDEIEQLKDL